MRNAPPGFACAAAPWQHVAMTVMPLLVFGCFAAVLAFLGEGIWAPLAALGLVMLGALLAHHGRNSIGRLRIAVNPHGMSIYYRDGKIHQSADWSDVAAATVEKRSGVDSGPTWYLILTDASGNEPVQLSLQLCSRADNRSLLAYARDRLAEHGVSLHLPTWLQSQD